MNDTVAVKIPDPWGNLSEIERGQAFREVTFLSDLLKETAICSKLQKKVDFMFIIEKSIHFEYVGMVWIHLNFNFLNKLFFHLRLLEFLLIDNFDCQSKACFNVSGHKNIPESPFSKFSSNLELTERELLFLRYFDSVLALLSV